MTSEEITRILTTGPSEDGTIPGMTGDSVPYRIKLLPPGVLNELRIARNQYLQERGIHDCTPATAEIFEAELQLRVCAAAVCKPNSDESLAPVESWRRHIGEAVRTCLDHYSRIEALAGEIDMTLAENLPALSAYVRKVGGAGQAAYWQTIDYETLLACFAALSLQHDEVERELQTLRADG